MKCEYCKQYKSAPLWNKCNLTGSECFYTIDNCHLVDDEGNDTGEFDRLLSNHEREMERIQTEVLQEQEPDLY